MKHAKQRRHRKVVTFYTACHGFRKPFKVLCDGTFLHNLAAHRVAPPDKAISNVLAAPVKLFTTRSPIRSSYYQSRHEIVSCVLDELKRLGKSHSKTLAAARDFAVARCDHEGKTKADTCILEAGKENNHEHFFVVTQDADLRKKLQERKFVKDSEEKRLHITEEERKRLEKKTGVILASQEPNHSVEEEDLGGHLNRHTAAGKVSQAARKGLGVKDKPQFKRESKGSYSRSP
ncbi:hypothetical protein CDL15_Pgr001134 [Punica granatum]|uniref:rRNA-processing protein UTP23 homolog n=1 Tax=Punica granatum TaxID=22663 RepID=A0A218WKW8_PUNGR|nr:hypothetical protein CDL15_Pgr001134 [Punica granatum]